MVIRKCVIALAEINYLSSIPKLIDLLNAGNWHVQSCATESLSIFIGRPDNKFILDVEMIRAFME